MVAQGNRMGGMTETEKRIALLVDGENIAPDHAGFLIRQAVGLGRLIICRVYGNATILPKWDVAPGFRLIHSGTGKNATDILMIVEAMDLALGGRADAFVIASSDTDFLPLLRHLKERGVPVHLIGEAKAPEALRKAAGRFVEIPVAKANPQAARTNGAAVGDARLLGYLRELVEAAPSGALLVSGINGPVSRDLKVKISQRPEKNWMAYLKAHPEVFDCDPRGKEARVRLRAG